MPRMQTRYFASDTDLTSPDTAQVRFYGNCPVWARKTREAGFVVASERVQTHGKAVRCDECGGSHVPVPPPWNPNA